jgi:uncharacterized protein YgbK (DUF1537 family)
MIAVIADDLTGAAELGAIGLRYGLGAEILSAKDKFPATAADLLCINTDSRSYSPVRAGQRTATAARKLRALKVEWIYKKVDSVLRGPVAAETASLMKQLGLGRTLLVPANPGRGRVIRDGRYFVNGKGIDETEFGHDPEHPRRSSSVRKLLGSRSPVSIHVCPVKRQLPARGLIVGEAGSPDDLCEWAGRWNGSTLAAGAAEFFAALLSRKGFGPLPYSNSPAVPIDALELFVSGSSSQSSRAFLAESRRRGVPVFCLPENLAHGARFSPSARVRFAQQAAFSLRSCRRVVLAIGLPLVPDPRIGKRLVNLLTQIAEAVLSQVQVEHVLVDGGATATALVQRLGWSRFKVIRENASGVVTLEPVSDPRCRLTIKPGSYAWPKEVTRWN